MSEAFGLLWTAIPMELVTEGMFPQAEACVEVDVDGRTLQVLPGTDGMGTVQRLISLQPADYLDPRFQPGSRVSITPRAQS